MFVDSLPATLEHGMSYPDAEDHHIYILRLSEVSESTTNPGIFVSTEVGINTMKVAILKCPLPMNDVRSTRYTLGAATCDRLL